MARLCRKAAMDVIMLVMTIMYVTARGKREAFGRLDWRTMELSRAGVRPRAHMPIIILFSEAMGLLHVDPDTTA